MKYCESPFVYRRRATREVKVGNIAVGGKNPIRVQSMITCDTMDTEASIRQTLDLANVGCEIVRITAPTVKDAANLQHIVAGLRARGCDVPIVADIHFKPDAAMEAAKWVEKVRVNPGNYADSKKFAVKEYTDDQYAAELDRIRERFSPLVKFCKEHGRAMRIGTNHGSLSDRIMNRYGDSPLGMVESALEFARIAREHDFHNFVFSMKSSNPKVMIECYRLLVARLAELDGDSQIADCGLARPSSDCLDSPPPPRRIADRGGAAAPTDNAASAAESELSAIRNPQSAISWAYPIHLGVTEAGEGEDGRIKSAIGIGSLLCDGLGDTIRVSLTEDSPHEIPVCRDLLAQIPTLSNSTFRVPSSEFPYDPFHYERRETPEIELSDTAQCGGEQTVRVVVTSETFDKVAPKILPKADVKPEAVYEDINLLELDPTQDIRIEHINCDTQLVTVKDGTPLPPVTAFRILVAKLKRLGRGNPILLKDSLNFEPVPLSPEVALLRAAVNLGALLADGIGDAILVRGESGAGQSLRLAFNILQAAGCRSFKTDYVACPSCGRTLFNLQTVTARIKARTEHLKGVKIAIMGCIVNGPGEMADADFGYVGGAPNKINLYVGRKPVKFNIPEAEAVERLVDLIKEHNKWVDPAPADAAAVH